MEGRQAVRELLRAGRRRVHQLVVAEGTDDSGPLAEILELARRRGVPARWVYRPQLDALATSEAPQGVWPGPIPSRSCEIEDPRDRPRARPVPFLVVLDGVTDPHNLGAVMRSAVGAGATGLVIGRHRAARADPGGAQGGGRGGRISCRRPWWRAFRPAWPVRSPRASGPLRLDADATGVVVGSPGGVGAGRPGARSEGRGLSRLVRQRCDVVVEVPLAGPIESLNVAAAAALACFEVARARQAAAR